MLLVLNTGSSSIKAALFDADLNEVLGGKVTGIGQSQGARLRVAGGDQAIDAPDHGAGLRYMLAALEQSGAGDITAAAHRVVHGGAALTAPARLTPDVISVIEDNVPLAPLHNPPGLAGIRAMADARPDLPQYASFDTAFHATQSELATTYAIPRSYRDEGIRRYGFHGLSYAGMVDQFGDALPKRLLAMHLGAGCSLCAIRDGKSVCTSMGYSPLSGPTMATRSGDIDGMAVLRLAREHGIDEATRRLNTESGLRGLAGTADMKTLLESDSEEAAFAVDHFIWSVLRIGGGLIAVMGGVDALAFTGGIGENAPEIRRRVTEGFAWLGDVPVHVVPAKEERQIASDAWKLIAAGA
ncbi:acetate/propionate family kinase [Psychromarinibacter sp. S121]|uniref:acetate/propionate family kinase n=1 Tax=Psychromarinibacter sp. S121 TaxID=3415127 RepID=UPI003C7BF970